MIAGPPSRLRLTPDVSSSSRRRFAEEHGKDDKHHRQHDDIDNRGDDAFAGDVFDC